MYTAPAICKQPPFSFHTITNQQGGAVMTLKKIPFNEWNTVLGLQQDHDDLELLYSPVISDAPIHVPVSYTHLTLPTTF